MDLPREKKWIFWRRIIRFSKRKSGFSERKLIVFTKEKINFLIKNWFSETKNEKENKKSEKKQEKEKIL